MSFWAKLADIEETFNDIEEQLGDPEIYQDQQKYGELAKKHSDLAQIVGKFREYKQVCADLDSNSELVKDPDAEIQELARLELEDLEQQKADLEEELKALLTPEDPLDKKAVILEIRAGTGGEEAALFAADLLRMYSRYAENNGWRVELLHSNQTGSGGFKEVIASISGGRVYSRLKYESGVHRVQRVPSTESQGRVHTSAVTVAILPEADEVDLKLDPHDLRIDVFRSSGPGGQSVNTTDSAVRITHEPTGLVITCQDEKSQLKNKAKAMKVLRSRLLQLKQDEAKQEMDQTRRAQVGSGDRSERIRTYNFPQSRITDHRINLTSHNLEGVMAGGLDEIITSLHQFFQTRAMQEQ
ncbi:MAG: peptide chain release factor 1 [Desulfohalobiaceae bacterium]|nr:peptide chain release factor 1 [Desulfohalobiaceae bacterium]